MERDTFIPSGRIISAKGCKYFRNFDMGNDNQSSCRWATAEIRPGVQYLGSTMGTKVAYILVESGFYA